MATVVDAKQNASVVTAHDVNIQVAIQLADLVKSTLGPYGMDKEMVDPAGIVVMTNDGATILRETKLHHPTARIITEVARTQEENCFDGTTSSVVITGELMSKAKELLNLKIHPTRIAKGYTLANKRAQILLEEIGVDITDDLPLSVGKTAMTGKSAEAEQDQLAQIAIDVIKATPLENINIVKRPNGKVKESLAISGLLIDREKMDHNMPDSVKDAKIALISVDVTLPEFAQQLQIQVTDNNAVKEFIESRKAQLQEIAESILSTGANVVLCKRDIDPFVVEIFAQKGVYAARRVAMSDMEAVAKAGKGRMVSAIDGLKESDLATVGLLEEIAVGEKPLIKLTDIATAGSVSVLLRGPTQHSVDEIGRAFDDAIRVISVAMEHGKVLAGGGAPYLHLSKNLREYAATVSGREQMAVEAYAQALEVIPAALAENSGLDPLDTLIILRQLHASAAGHSNGVDVENGGGVNMLEQGVIEPLSVVSQALDSATDIASQLLRIDNIIEMQRGPEIGEDGYKY